MRYTNIDKWGSNKKQRRFQGKDKIFEGFQEKIQKKIADDIEKKKIREEGHHESCVCDP